MWLEPYRLATRLVTCGEYAEFMADGGYRRPELWLSAGWDAVQNKDGARRSTGRRRWRVERVYIARNDGAGWRCEDVPVSQVSYFEADAYARWAGRRLPSEFEWEAAAEGARCRGQSAGSGLLMPAPQSAEGAQSENVRSTKGRSMQWGDCWQWTASAYLGYPGFKALEGTLGEYNGKFMSGQMVLRGGSCVTPARHIRASYRNFFAPGDTLAVFRDSVGKLIYFGTQQI